jgi:predicted LPLAT superfamily acyltransferase
MDKQNEQTIKQPNKLKERGGTFGRAFLHFMGKYFGFWAIIPFSPFIVPYFLIVMKDLRRNMMKYWSCIRPNKSKLTYLFYISKQYLSFADSLLDRAGQESGKLDKYLGKNKENIANGEIVRRELKKDNGVMLLCSHIGGYNLYTFVSDFLVDKPVNVFMYDQQVKFSFSDKVNKNSIKFINPVESNNAAFQTYKALENKEVVVVMGDRVDSENERYEIFNVNNVGLKIPLGPWHIARASGATVICMFVVKEKGQYNLIIKEPIDMSIQETSKLEKKEIIKDAMSKYIGYLSEILAKYPFQWYNFNSEIICNVR